MEEAGTGSGSSAGLSHADRLIYRFDDDNLHVIAIGGQYEG